MRLPSFSAKIEMNWPGSKSNTGSFSNVNRMRYVWGNFGAMSKTSFTITVCLPDRNLTGVSWTTGFCGVTAFAGAVPRIIAKLGTRQSNLNISSRVARSARHTNAHPPRQTLARFFEEGVRIEEARDGAPKERADPVHVPVDEETGNDRGAEPSSGVHRGTGERSAHHDVDCDRQTNRHSTHGVEGSFRVDTRAEDDENVEEGQLRLLETHGPGSDVPTERRGCPERRGAKMVRLPNVNREHGGEGERPADTAQELRDPVNDSEAGREFSADEGAEGGRPVVVPPRNNGQRGHPDL